MFSATLHVNDRQVTSNTRVSDEVVMENDEIIIHHLIVYSRLESTRSKNRTTTLCSNA